MATSGWLLLSHSFARALLAPVSVLVAYPCALDLATPLSIATSMGRAAVSSLLVVSNSLRLRKTPS